MKTIDDISASTNTYKWRIHTFPHKSTTEIFKIQKSDEADFRLVLFTQLVAALAGIFFAIDASMFGSLVNKIVGGDFFGISVSVGYPHNNPITDFLTNVAFRFRRADMLYNVLNIDLIVAVLGVASAIHAMCLRPIVLAALRAQKISRSEKNTITSDPDVIWRTVSEEIDDAIVTVTKESP